uniref:C2H2-type domain-containing protein n=1 Tax=viral metagenome TaxID=1070528 RepID=A0A6C0FAF9_9ZZZZ
MSTVLSPKIPLEYICETCDYATCNKKDYRKHLLTDKHKNLNISTDFNKKSQEIPNHSVCECGKIYKDRSGLWRHKKKCIKTQNINEDSENENTPGENKIIMKLLKQNNELQSLLFEQNKQLIENASKPNITNNSIVNSKVVNNFNLNMFLNETCKDAMNLTDFVESLKLTLADLETTGKLGYEKGISQIFINGLKQLDVTKRPIHCTDTKREKLHIRDKDAWETDQEKEKIRKAIKNVANKNMNQICDWIKENPDSQSYLHGESKYNSKKNDQYLNIVLNATGGKTQDDEEKKINKVITVIAKHVEVDKEVS